MEVERRREEMCDQHQKVLQFLQGELAEEKSEQVETHIEQCARCRALLEGYMAGAKSVAIPRHDYQGADERLKEQVVHYERGTRRILIFALVGMIMGWFSRNYIDQEFFVIKLLIGIPYKISEIIYRTLGGWRGNGNFSKVLFEYWNMDVNVMTNYLPFSNVLSAWAEYVTPVLIGGFLYGSLAYFTGDKRIFTLTRYLKYAALWAISVALYVVILFGAYQVHLGRLNGLRGLEGVDVKTKWGSRYVPIEKEEPGSPFRAYEESLPEGETMQQEKTITLCFAHDRFPARIHLEEGYLRTFGGSVYDLSDEWTEIIEGYMEAEE